VSTSLYISSAEAHAGKSIVALGVMETLARRVDRIGVFRPIVAEVGKHNSLVDLLIQRYELNVDYSEACPFTYADIAEHLESGNPERVVADVVEKYAAFKAKYDFVLIIGTDFVGPAAASEFDLNAELAANLGSPVLLVMTAQEKDDHQLRASLGSARHVLVDHGCSVVATIVNRVDADHVESLRTEMHGASEPTFIVKDIPLLSALTVGEVAEGLGGDLISGDGPNLQREVDRYVAGSGHVPMVLDLMDAGALLIAAGDRADLAVAAAAVAASPDYPTPAGLLLTCGVIPDEHTIQLLRSTQLPVVAVASDTYQTLHALDQLRGEIRVGSRRKIAVALAEFAAAVDADLLADRIQLSKPSAVTPLMFSVNIMERARADRKHIVLPESDDERILWATDELIHGGIVDITLLGDEQTVQARAKHLGIDIAGAKIVDPITSPLIEEFATEYARLRAHKGVTKTDALDRVTDPTYFATLLVHLGYADGMVSGATHTTAETVRPAFEIIKTKPGVFLMCLPDRVLAFADCAVNPDPTAEQLADIAASTAETAHAFGIEPRVAMLSYSTGESGSGVDVDKVRTATNILSAAHPEVPVAGPIQYDAAVDAGVGKAKMPDNPVAGQATVLIFPDLNSGNTAYKAVQRSSNAVAIGPVLQGLKKPVNDLSRGCTIPDIVNTVAITAIQAQTSSAK
jgi:phosphate acetyltransferase